MDDVRVNEVVDLSGKVQGNVVWGEEGQSVATVLGGGVGDCGGGHFFLMGMLF